MAKPGPRKTNFETMAARFPSGTFRRIYGVLAPKETRAEFLRAAVDREVKRRGGEPTKDIP